jgi:bacterioferritin
MPRYDICQTPIARRRHGVARDHYLIEEDMMKGQEKIWALLNQLLASELTAISQYMVHAEMCDNWGYQALHKSVEARAFTEMKHAEKLIARILFLDGTPRVDKLNPMHIGSDVPKQFESDLKLEMGAWKSYNEAIKLANEVGDSPTKNLLEDIVRDEDDHIDDLEEKRDQAKQLGKELYLSQQIKE